MKLQAGDYFVVRTNSWIAEPILLAQKLKSLDGKAEYNHAGIILDCVGNTYESLRRIDYNNIHAYVGCPIMIVRYKEMTPEKFKKGMDEVLKYKGMIYPWWRLALHLVGRIARPLHLTMPVCSELVGLHKYHAGVACVNGWGWNPDDLADNWEINKYVDILMKGKWDGDFS